VCDRRPHETNVPVEERSEPADVVVVVGAGRCRGGFHRGGFYDARACRLADFRACAVGGAGSVPGGSGGAAIDDVGEGVFGSYPDVEVGVAGRGALVRDGGFRRPGVDVGAGGGADV